jgi:hypothetical protein
MASQNSSQDAHYETGRLPMTDEELRIMERNRRLTRRIMVPLMGIMGASGVAGGVFYMAEGWLAVNIGLVISGLIMSGFAWFYYSDSKRPVERPEKFFVTGVITRKRKSGDFTRRYYSIELNGDRYKCFIDEAEFDRLKVGDRVQCERLLETSVFADRVVVLDR